MKIEWNATKGYKLNDGVFTKIDTLEILGNLVGELNDKTGKGNENCFTLAFGGGVVKVCGGGNIDITTDANFETLLGYITTLKNTNKAINSIFKIKIAITQKGNGINLNTGNVDQNFIKTASFWNAVKNHKELFGDLPIAVAKNTGKSKKVNSKQGKIGTTVIEVKMFNGEDIAEGWQEIFKKK